MFHLRFFVEFGFELPDLKRIRRYLKYLGQNSDIFLLFTDKITMFTGYERGHIENTE